MSRRLLYAFAACLAAPAAASAQVTLPTGGDLPRVDFERHVMGLVSKAGCNSGSCHGSFQGKNGFRLSLFGYEPAFDYAALTRDNFGRRVDVQRPENSLLLLKATGAVAHEGGMRFGKGSWTYEVFREWVRQGAPHSPRSGEIAELRVTPPGFAVVKDGASLQVKVTAAFADGSAEDVTPFCDFKVSDDAVAAYRSALVTWPGAQAARVALMTLLLARGESGEAEKLAEAVQAAPERDIDPWWAYEQGDFRMLQSLLAMLRRSGR